VFGAPAPETSASIGKEVGMSDFMMELLVLGGLLLLFVPVAYKMIRKGGEPDREDSDEG
jgi:hypothetical protein